MPTSSSGAMVTVLLGLDSKEESKEESGACQLPRWGHGVRSVSKGMPKDSVGCAHHPALEVTKNFDGSERSNESQSRRERG